MTIHTTETQTLRYSVPAEPPAFLWPVELDTERLAKANMTVGQLAEIASSMRCKINMTLVDKESPK